MAQAPHATRQQVGGGRVVQVVGSVQGLLSSCSTVDPANHRDAVGAIIISAQKDAGSLIGAIKKGLKQQQETIPGDALILVEKAGTLPLTALQTVVKAVKSSFSAANKTVVALEMGSEPCDLLWDTEVAEAPSHGPVDVDSSRLDPAAPKPQQVLSEEALMAQLQAVGASVNVATASSMHSACQGDAHALAVALGVVASGKLGSAEHVAELLQEARDRSLAALPLAESKQHMNPAYGSITAPSSDGGASSTSSHGSSAVSNGGYYPHVQVREAAASADGKQQGRSFNIECHADGEASEPLQSVFSVGQQIISTHQASPGCANTGPVALLDSWIIRDRGTSRRVSAAAAASARSSAEAGRKVAVLVALQALTEPALQALGAVADLAVPMSRSTALDVLVQCMPATSAWRTKGNPLYWRAREEEHAESVAAAAKNRNIKQQAVRAAEMGELEPFCHDCHRNGHRHEHHLHQKMHSHFIVSEHDGACHGGPECGLDHDNDDMAGVVHGFAQVHVSPRRVHGSGTGTGGDGDGQQGQGLSPRAQAQSTLDLMVQLGLMSWCPVQQVLAVPACVEQVVRAVIGSPVLLMQAGISPRHEDGKQLMAVKARALAALMAGITTDMHEVAGAYYAGDVRAVTQMMHGLSSRLAALLHQPHADLLVSHLVQHTHHHSSASDADAASYAHARARSPAHHLINAFAESVMTAWAPLNEHLPRDMLDSALQLYSSWADQQAKQQQVGSADDEDVVLQARLAVHQALAEGAELAHQAACHGLGLALECVQHAAAGAQAGSASEEEDNRFRAAQLPTDLCPASHVLSLPVRAVARVLAASRMAVDALCARLGRRHTQVGMCASHAAQLVLELISDVKGAEDATHMALTALQALEAVMDSISGPGAAGGRPHHANHARGAGCDPATADAAAGNSTALAVPPMSPVMRGMIASAWLRAQSVVARLHLRAHDAPAAVQVLAASLARGSSVLGKQHAEVMRLSVLLAQALEASGQYAAAAQRYGSALCWARGLDLTDCTVGVTTMQMRGTPLTQAQLQYSMTRCLVAASAPGTGAGAEDAEIVRSSLDQLLEEALDQIQTACDVASLDLQPMAAPDSAHLQVHGPVVQALVTSALALHAFAHAAVASSGADADAQAALHVHLNCPSTGVQAALDLAVQLLAAARNAGAAGSSAAAAAAAALVPALQSTAALLSTVRSSEQLAPVNNSATLVLHACQAIQHLASSATASARADGTKALAAHCLASLTGSWSDAGQLVKACAACVEDAAAACIAARDLKYARPALAAATSLRRLHCSATDPAALYCMHLEAVAAMLAGRPLDAKATCQHILQVLDHVQGQDRLDVNMVQLQQQQPTQQQQHHQMSGKARASFQALALLRRRCAALLGAALLGLGLPQQAQYVLQEVATPAGAGGSTGAGVAGGHQPIKAAQQAGSVALWQLAASAAPDATLSLADAYMAQQQYSTASTLLQAVISPGADAATMPLVRLLATARLGACQWHMGQSAEAAATLLGCVDDAQACLGEGHVGVAQVLDLLAAFFMSQGHPRKAELLLSRSLELKEDLLLEFDHQEQQQQKDVKEEDVAWAPQHRHKRSLSTANTMQAVLPGARAAHSRAPSHVDGSLAPTSARAKSSAVPRSAVTYELCRTLLALAPAQLQLCCFSAARASSERAEALLSGPASHLAVSSGLMLAAALSAHGRALQGQGGQGQRDAGIVSLRRALALAEEAAGAGASNADGGHQHIVVEHLAALAAALAEQPWEVKAVLQDHQLHSPRVENGQVDTSYGPADGANATYAPATTNGSSGPLGTPLLHHNGKRKVDGRVEAVSLLSRAVSIVQVSKCCVMDGAGGWYWYGGAVHSGVTLAGLLVQLAVTHLACSNAAYAREAAREARLMACKSLREAEETVAAAERRQQRQQQHKAAAAGGQQQGSTLDRAPSESITMPVGSVSAVLASGGAEDTAPCYAAKAKASGNDDDEFDHGDATSGGGGGQAFPQQMLPGSGMEELPEVHVDDILIDHAGFQTNSSHNLKPMGAQAPAAAAHATAARDGHGHGHAHAMGVQVQQLSRLAGRATWACALAEEADGRWDVSEELLRAALVLYQRVPASSRDQPLIAMEVAEAMWALARASTRGACSNSYSSTYCCPGLMSREARRCLPEHIITVGFASGHAAWHTALPAPLAAYSQGPHSVLASYDDPAAAVQQQQQGVGVGLGGARSPTSPGRVCRGLVEEEAALLLQGALKLCNASARSALHALYGAEIRLALARVHLEQGDASSIREAELLAHKALAVMQERCGHSRHPAPTDAMVVAATCIAARAHAMQAEQVQRERQGGGAGAAALVPCPAAAAMFYKARSMVEQALRSRQLLFNVDSPPALQAQELLAHIVGKGLADWQQAEPLYRSALDIRAEHLGPGHACVMSTAQAYITMLVDHGRLGTASNFISKYIAKLESAGCRQEAILPVMQLQARVLHLMQDPAAAAAPTAAANATAGGPGAAGVAQPQARPESAGVASQRAGSFTNLASVAAPAPAHQAPALERTSLGRLSSMGSSAAGASAGQPAVAAAAAAAGMMAVAPRSGSITTMMASPQAASTLASAGVLLSRSSSRSSLANATATATAAPAAAVGGAPVSAGSSHHHLHHPLHHSTSATSILDRLTGAAGAQASAESSGARAMASQQQAQAQRVRAASAGSGSAAYYAHVSGGGAGVGCGTMGCLRSPRSMHQQQQTRADDSTNSNNNNDNDALAAGLAMSPSDLRKSGSSNKGGLLGFFSGGKK